MEILFTYLFNVTITFFAYLLFFVPLFTLAFIFRRYIPVGYREMSRQIVSAFLFLFLILSAILPSNIPKNESFDRETTQREISKIDEARQSSVSGLSVTDQTRKLKMDEAERKDHFGNLVDFRNR
jgi:glucan phosphoethanolaminetransferase (alkaline phosphatase superfamily)